MSLPPVLWIGALICLLALSGVSAAPTRSNYVEEAQSAEINGTVYKISGLASNIFVKTDPFELNYNSCLQFSYKLNETRVKLRAYTCQLSEGGYCTLDKFVYPKQKAGCGYLRPWAPKDDSFSFYFVLERRARKYRSGRGRNLSKRTLSNKTFGELQIDGIMPCEDVCGGVIPKSKKRNQTSV